mgnify:CR=1 FL=1
MQHGRATSALGGRGFAGRSRAMSILMALCLFAAVALAIPGFTARADSNDEHYAIPNTSFRISLENAAQFEADYGTTGYWAVVLDDGGVTPKEKPTFERHGEIVTADAHGLWMAAALNNSTMVVPVPNGTNNVQGTTWQPGTQHSVTVVIYQDERTLVSTRSYSVKVFAPNNEGRTDPPDPADKPTTDPAPQPDPQPSTDPAPEPSTDPAPQPDPQPSTEPAPTPDDPALPVVRPTPTPSESPSASPSASTAAHSPQPSDTPVSPVTDESQLTDANKGGVSAAFTAGQLTINVPADKATVGEWVSANIMQTGEARWLQVADDNRVTMDVNGLPMGDYKVVVANRSHELVGWAEFKVASTLSAGAPGSSVDASGSVKLHAEVLSSSNAGDESEGLNGYLLGAGACMLILGGLVVLQVLSGPKIGSSSHGVTLT